MQYVGQFQILLAFVMIVQLGVSLRIVASPFHARSKLCSTLAASSGRAAENISSSTNAKVKLLKSLSVKKRREELQLVLVEGHRAIVDAIEAGVIPNHLLFSDKATTAPLAHRLDAAIRKLPLECSVSRVTDSVLSTVSDTITDQGVAAAFTQPTPSPEPLDKLAKGSNKLIVVLDRVRDPGNLGTLLRSCYGLGADAVVCVDSCDIWSPKTLRSSTAVHLTTATTMPVYEHRNWDTLNDVIWRHQETAKRPLQVVIAEGGEKSNPYTAIDYAVPTVLVVGNEGSGASKEARSVLGKVVYAGIPMQRKLESFNAAVAGTVILAAAAQQRAAMKPGK